MVIIDQGQGTNFPSTITTTATTAAAPTPGSTTTCGCCAAPGATPAVKRTRGTAIAIIVLHAIALFAIGYIFWAQWLGSLAGIIMASILLCVFQKGCYITAAIVFAIGGIFDIVAMVSWIQLAQAFDEAGEDGTYSYYYDDDYDETTDEWGEAAKGLAVLPAIAALIMFIGTAFATNAVMTWDQIATQASPNVVQNINAVGRITVAHATIPVSGQPPFVANVVGGKGVPPPYTG